MIRFRILGPALGVALLAGACGGTPAGGTTAGSSPGSAAESPVAPPSTAASPATSAAPAAGDCGGGDVAKALTAASTAQHAADSYRVTGTITTTTATEALIEVQKPDGIHAKFGDMEYISVGGTTWRNVGGTWQAAPGVDVASLIAGMGQLDSSLITNATFTNVSTKQTFVDGAPAIEYDYHESITGQLEADVQLWLDPATCRPIHNVARSTASSTASTYDVTYSDWDAVTVSPPQ